VTVRADNVIVATNVPINDRFVMETKIEPFRTYVISAPIAKKAVPKALFWDSGDPYHYVRLAHSDNPNEKMLIVGGEDHKVGHESNFEERYNRLHAWARERFPNVGEIHKKWSGQVIEPVDDVAFIGRNPGNRNVYIVTGDSGNGMTHGTIAAMMFTDMVQGKHHPWEKFFNPSRKMFRDKKEFVAHNIDAGSQYKDWFTPGEVQQKEDIPLGSGAVIRQGLAKVAIYRDEAGEVHEMSAVCPHAKGIVHWNQDEKTWDCPVHGSRFDELGHVINGPANQNLQSKEHIKVSGDSFPHESPLYG